MYIIIEIQTNQQGETAYLVDKKATMPEALQKYHLILAAASVSGLPRHAAVILNDRGDLVKRECYGDGGAEE